ncbi:MAG TPA: hypothetical protein EYP10_13625, partial [Armatimonadetes bacterium]|nr:hypothetical protein [Armatimonadota bacterium]
MCSACVRYMVWNGNYGCDVGGEEGAMNDSLGYFCMVLHTHIPYVLGHGTWPHGSEMLYEAVAGCYLRLLDCLNALLSQGIRARITMSITPVVMEQLSDERFKGWFSANLEHRIATAAYNREEFEWRNEPHLAVLAQRWQEHFIALRDAFHQRYFADIIGSFRYLQEQGAIELMTSAGTHGYLPLLREEGSVHAQIEVGVHTYRRHFGRQPHGFWLPECAYRPQCMWDVPSEIGPTGSPWFRKGLEQWLALNGIEYFIVDSHGFGDGHPIAVDVERADPSRDGPLWR